MTNTEQSGISIGRASDNEIVVAHQSVSAHHAIIWTEGANKVLKDLSSTNGTFLNGVRISTSVLTEGDSIHFGQIAYVFENGKLSLGILENEEEATKHSSDSADLKISPKVSLTVIISIALLVVGFFVFNSDDKPSNKDKMTAPGLEIASETDWESMARSVVMVISPSCGFSGSGTIVLNGSHVLTNHHVAALNILDLCELEVWGTDSLKQTPRWIANAKIVENAYDSSLDLAVIKLLDRAGMPTKITDRNSVELSSNELKLGDQMKIFGYPAMGGDKITVTPGDNAGWWTDDSLEKHWSGEFYKTSAKMGPGVSGGAAFNAVDGSFVGIPTGRGDDSEGEGDVLGLVRPSRYAVPLLESADS